jgi:HEAT repeat protein
VKRLRRKKNVEKLATATRYRDRFADRNGRVIDLGIPIRIQALQALGTIEDPAAVEPILEALEDDSRDVRLTALHLLRTRQEPGVADGVASVAAAWAGDEAARGGALEVLAEVAGDKAAEHLAPALILHREGSLELQDRELLEERIQHAETREHVVERAVEALGGETDSPTRDRACQVLTWQGDASFDPLMRLLSRAPSGDVGLRCMVCATLGTLHDARAVEALASMLEDESDPPVRRAAARALGEIRSPLAVQALTKATLDDDYFVRVGAIEALDRLGNAGVVWGLAGLLRPLLPLRRLDGDRGDRPALPGQSSRPAMRWLVGQVFGRQGRRRRSHGRAWAPDAS